MTAEDVLYVYVQRVRWDATVIPGSTVVTAHCGHRAFIAPTGQEFMRGEFGQGAYLICTDCMPADELLHGDTKRFSLPGALEELEALRPGYGDQVGAFMRDHGIKPWHGG